MQTPTNTIAVFQNKEVRKIWQNDQWYFSVVDIVEVLTDSTDPKDYWYRIKKRATHEEGIELSTICRQLKLESSDGKKYATDCANTEGISKKTETVKNYFLKNIYGNHSQNIYRCRNLQRICI